jgi:predicted GIY-YIG superfamily endonuclease
VRLAYFEEHSTRQEAQQREEVLRRLPRAIKLKLITL